MMINDFGFTKYPRTIGVSFTIFRIKNLSILNRLIQNQESNIKYHVIQYLVSKNPKI